MVIQENSFKFNSNAAELRRIETMAAIRNCMARCAIEYVIGISGSADGKNSLRAPDIVESFMSKLQYNNCAILTGGTEGGLPQLGIEVAKKYDIPTIGVFPKQGAKYALKNLLDLAIEISPPDIGEGIFGTETPSFVNMLDGAMIIGGEYGTLTEAATILKVNTKRVRNRLRGQSVKHPIYLVPIAGSGGAADIVYDTMRAIDCDTGYCIPNYPIDNGSDAADFIICNLNSET